MTTVTKPAVPKRPTRTAGRASKPSTTIRVSVEVRDQLQSRAETDSVTVGDVVRSLLEADEEHRYWEEMRLAVERTKADPEDWAEYWAENDLFEGASLTDFQEYVKKHDL